MGTFWSSRVQQPHLRTVFVLLSDKLVSSWPEIASQVRADAVSSEAARTGAG